jgi:hypothetical protein
MANATGPARAFLVRLRPDIATAHRLKAQHHSDLLLQNTSRAVVIVVFKPIGGGIEFEFATGTHGEEFVSCHFGRFAVTIHKN